MYVVVTFENHDKAYINLLEYESKRTGKGSILYTSALSKANQIIEYFDKITDVDESNSANVSTCISIADELKKYTDLYKSGALSDDEYMDIKEKLLAKL